METKVCRQIDWRLTDMYHYSILEKTPQNIGLSLSLRIFSMLSVGVPCQAKVTLPGIILDAAQGQTEGHVTTKLLGGSHESLQIVLRTGTQGGDWRVTHWREQRLTFCFVSVVYDSQWSTVWSLGSSLTCHPPLSTLPTHLYQMGQKTYYSLLIDRESIHVKLLQQWGSYPRLLLLLTSFSGTWSCRPHSVKQRQKCWRGAGNQWPHRLEKSKNNYLTNVLYARQGVQQRLSRPNM